MSDNWNGFVGTAVPITDGDIAYAARQLGVRWSRLRGVMSVESAWHRGGDGFDSHGRPKMLFEPLLFYRALAHDREAQAAAVSAGLASPTRPLHYPAESYTRLTAAIEIDETAALSSASWGFPQVLGSNYRMGGWKSVQEMVRACMAGEAGHLRAFVGFINANRLVDELVSGDAAGFARVYNGAGYARDGYQNKIEAAWKKYDAMPDPAPNFPAPAVVPDNTVIADATDPFSQIINQIGAALAPPANAATGDGEPLVPSVSNNAITAPNNAPPVVAPAPVPPPQPASEANAIIAHYMDKPNAMVKAVQGELNTLNYACGTPDGIFGPLLRASLLAYEANNNLPLRKDVLDTVTMNAVMINGVAKPLAEERKTATANSPELRASRTIMLGKMMRRIWVGLFGFFGITTVTPDSPPEQIVGNAIDNKDSIIAKASSTYDVIHHAAETIVHSPILIGAASLLGIVAATAVINLRVQEHRTGQNLGK